MNLGEVKVKELTQMWFEINATALESAFPPEIVSLIRKGVGNLVMEESTDRWKIYAWRYQYKKNGSQK